MNAPKIKAVVVRDPVKALCAKYESALRKRDELRAAHLDTFARDRAMADDIATLENEIKEAVRPRYDGHEKGTFVEYVGATATIKATVKRSVRVDADAILEEAPELRQHAGLIETTVNRGMLAILIKGKHIAPELAARHTTEEQATTAITISRTEADESGKVSATKAARPKAAAMLAASPTVATVTRIR